MNVSNNKIYLTIQAEINDITKNFHLLIAKSTKIINLKTHILSSKLDFSDELSQSLLPQCYVIYNSMILINYETLEERNVLDEDILIFRIGKSGLDMLDIIRKKCKIENPVNFAPIFNKRKYFTSPPFEDIRNYSIYEVENVENFSVYNEFGKIEFLGKTDLSYLNLNNIITIKENEVKIFY